MNQRLSASQLRAARGLLDWTRAELAKRSGVSEPTIHRIETGVVQPHEKSITSLIRVFDENGVEFMDDGGVRPKRQSVEVLTGRPGQQTFFNNVYEYMRSYGGTIVQLGIDESQFLKAAGAEYTQLHNKRMTQLVEERKDIKVLAIVREGDTNLVFSGYNHYRWISKDIFAPVSFYMYGETLAIIDYQTVPPPTIIVHKSPVIAKAYRKQFEVFWKMSKEPRLHGNSKSL